MQFSTNKSLLSRKGRRTRKRGGETKRGGTKPGVAQGNPLYADGGGGDASFSSAPASVAKPLDDAEGRREERKVARRREKMATRLQSFFRGRSVAFNTLGACAARLYKRVNDLKLLVAALAARNKTFAVPPETILSLCGELLFVSRRASGWEFGGGGAPTATSAEAVGCLDSLCEIFLSSLASTEEKSNVAVSFFGKDHTHRIATFLSVCLANLLTRVDLLKSKAGGGWSMLPRAKLIVFLISPPSREDMLPLAATFCQWSNEHVFFPRTSPQGLFASVRGVILNLISDGSKWHVQKPRNELLSNALLPIVTFGVRTYSLDSEGVTKKFLLPCLQQLFTVPYFYMFVSATPETCKFFLKLWPELLRLIVEDPSIVRSPAGGSILHCNCHLSVFSNMCSLLKVYLLVVGKQNTPHDIKVNTLALFFQFADGILEHLPMSVFEHPDRFIVMAKLGARLTSFELPVDVVQQIHVLTKPSTVLYMFDTMLPSWTPNEQVTERIRPFTVEKQAADEAEQAAASRSGIWGKFLGSASWAKKIFKKRSSVSTDTWSNEGSTANASVPMDGKKQAKWRARNGSSSSTAPPVNRSHVYTLCSVYMQLLWRWPGAQRARPVTFSLLNTLAFNTASNVSGKLWAYLETSDELAPILKEEPCERTLGVGKCVCKGTLAVLGLFTVVYTHAFTVLDDNDLYTSQRTLPIASMIRYILRAKFLVYKMYWEIEDAILENGKVPASPNAVPFGVCLRDAIVVLLKMLHDRNSRRAFCVERTWLVEEAVTKMGKGDRFVSLLKYGAFEVAGKSKLLGVAWERQKRLQALTAHHFLQALPFSVQFSDRLRLFNHILKDERVTFQNDEIAPIRVRIKREHVFIDGFKHMNKLGARLKQRIYVNFIDNMGNEESGIDAGGLFKEFWTSLSKVAFDMNYGLWALTENQLMYPSPQSNALHDNHLELYEFLGRVLGKAIYEGIVVQPQFTFFFLRKLLGKVNTLSDLPTLDPELYKNLMFMKNYKGDIEDLCLAFTAVDSCLGVNTEVPLIPNGENVPVTDENKLKYIYLVAHYRLNIKLQKQCSAFIRGLRDVVPLSWLGLFSENELQSVISGISKGIDIADLQAHARYAGGYVSISPSVRRLWAVLKTFSQKEREKFLQFVTSCERAPPLGFSQLEPPFCIQWVPDTNRLPSASTCFNTLKIPDYGSQSLLRKKLIYVINSNAGFGLT
jgi:ubiquitin-protein ligase E3 C